MSNGYDGATAKVEKGFQLGTSPPHIFVQLLLEPAGCCSDGWLPNQWEYCIWGREGLVECRSASSYAVRQYAEDWRLLTGEGSEEETRHALLDIVEREKSEGSVCVKGR